ncbi:MAG: glycosyltransferase [Planctomycetes bacterium]|nr:glycosyltransferase [Planctomycetota bacterium]MBI3845876.1 glycosyltransferase [Planctomycetota bacterium]
MGEPKRLLVVTYHFPPSNVTGTFRLLGFVRHLERLGWRSTVVTVRDPEGDPKDPELIARIPATTIVVRTASPDVLKRLAALVPRTRAKGVRSGATESSPPARSAVDYLSRLLVTPDSKIGWIPFAARAGIRAGRDVRPHAILSSGPPWSAHRAALRIARRLRVPWAADFRDPWATSPFVEIPYPSLRRRNERLEAEVVREARLVLCNTDALEQNFRERYPAEPRDKFLTLTNGYDPEDFDGLVPTRPAPGKLRLLHPGVLYGKRNPRGLLTALGQIRDRDPDVARALDFRFVGFLREERFDMEQVAVEWGLEGIVSGQGSVGHREALSLMRGADALLVLGLAGGEPESQVPAKVYEYVGADRFILSLSHPQGAIARILAQSGRPHRVVGFDDVAGIRAAILELHERWKCGELRARDDADWKPPVTPFTRAALTARLAAALDSIITPA